MKKSLTHTELTKIQMKAAMYAVMDLLEWDLMTYSQFKYECGLKYLEAYLHGDKEAIDQMSRAVSYWGWWRLHWFIREQEWLANPEIAQWRNGSMVVNVVGHIIEVQRLEDHPAVKMGICTIPMFTKFGRRNNYRQLHDPVELASGTSETSKELDDSYSRELVPRLK